MRRMLVAVAAAALVLVPGASAWTWPVDGPVLREFRFGGDPYAAGQHRGIDIGGAVGSPVRAAASGVVSFAGTVPGGGKTVTVRTQDGYSVTHLQLGSIAVAKGVAVEEGDPVGALGPSEDGEQTEPHVHLGVRVAADTHGYVDPLLLLPPRVLEVPPDDEVDAGAAVPSAADPDEPEPEPDPGAGSVVVEPDVAGSLPANEAGAPTTDVADDVAGSETAPTPFPSAVPAPGGVVRVSRRSTAGDRAPRGQPDHRARTGCGG